MMKPRYQVRLLKNFILRQKNKIRVKLFVTYFVIIIFTILTIGLTSYYFSSSSLETKLTKANEEIIEQMHRNLEFDFQQIKGVMLLPYNFSDFYTGLNVYSTMNELERAKYQEKMSDYFLLSFYAIHKSDLENFYLFTKNGQILYTSDIFGRTQAEKNFKTAAWVGKTREKNGDVYFSDAHTINFGGRKTKVFSTSIMIKDLSNTSYYSYVKADFNFSVISDICDSKMLGQGSKTVLLDERGNIIYSTGDKMPAGAFHGKVLSKMNRDGGNFRWTLGGVPYLLSYAKSNISGWNIVSLLPESRILDASRSIRDVTIAISILAFLLTMVISATFASQFTKPLLKLHKMVDRVRHGDLSVRLKETGADEISSIYSAFNLLIEEVNALIETKYVYQIRQRESELNLLYAQINPHFLYNTLDTIRVMADCREIDNVSRMITLLGDMLRYGVRNINEPVTVEQEFQHIEGYLSICSIRFGDKIRFEIHRDDEIRNKKIPRLILQPVIENSVRHGMHRGRNVMAITVSGVRQDGRIVFTVRDNGKGISKKDLEEIRRSLRCGAQEESNAPRGDHIGLNNISGRLRLLYGEGEYIAIESSPGNGTEVTVFVPLELPEPAHPVINPEPGSPEGGKDTWQTAAGTGPDQPKETGRGDDARSHQS